MNGPRAVVGKAAAPLLLVLGGAVLAVALAEGLLALGGRRPDWRYCTGWAEDHPVYRYRFHPGRYPGLFGCDTQINSFRARGPEPVEPVVLSLGDSCTFGVDVAQDEAYPFLLSRRPGDVIDAGVPGYNTYLGKWWLRDSGFLALRPRLVTIYFGWNDHYKAAATEEVFSWLRRAAAYGHSRVAASLLRLEASLFSDDPAWRKRSWIPAVPLRQFRGNLREMVDECRRAGAVVVLITPPSEFRLAQAGQGFFAARPIQELYVHTEYAQAVRDVAAQTRCGLVDLESELRARAAADPREYFRDFAHLNRKGHRVAAELLKPWVACAQAGSCTDRP